MSHGTRQVGGHVAPRTSWVCRITFIGRAPRRGCEPAKANCNTTTSAVQSRNHPRPKLSCHGVRGLIMHSFRLVWLGRCHMRHEHRQHLPRNYRTGKIKKSIKGRTDDIKILSKRSGKDSCSLNRTTIFSSLQTSKKSLEDFIGRYF